MKVQFRHLMILMVLLLAACTGQPGSQSPASPTGAATPVGLALSTATVEAAAAAPASTATGQAAIPVTSTEAPSAEATGASAASTVTAPAASPTAAAAQPAPTCASPAELTPPMTEGPYFKAGSPERANLAEGLPGTHLTLTGFVLTSDCQPVANALLDFWQADSQGQYDNSGYTLRGHIQTDASGRYQIETVVPGLYPGRTEHIHVKVQAPGGPILTTQLFFPGVAQNEQDGIFDPRLLITIQQESGGLSGTYDFVVAK
jgi:protocatechuate 3,4-dioxygenase beta subunit